MRLGYLCDRYPGNVRDLHDDEPECHECGEYKTRCTCAEEEDDE